MMGSLAAASPAMGLGLGFVYAASIDMDERSIHMPETPPDAKYAINPDRWLEQHGNILFRFALARVRDRETAEDLVQETFLAALRSQANYQGRAAEQTWLVGILRHKIIDHLRRRREVNLPADEDGENQDELIDRLFSGAGHWRHSPKPWKDPRQSLQQAEFYTVLQHCLQALPGRHGEVFSLYLLQQQSSDSVCQALDISPSNFGVIMYRARLRLRQCLEVNWFAAG